MRQDESKTCKEFLALRLKKKKTDKGRKRLDRQGDKTDQGHPGTD